MAKTITHDLVTIDIETLDKLKEHLTAEFGTYKGFLKIFVTKAVKEYLKKEKLKTGGNNDE